MDTEKQEITAAEVGTVEEVLAPAKVVHKFMPGEECAITGKPDANGVKVIGIEVAEDGSVKYRVAYGVVEMLTEADLAKLEE